MQEILYRYQMTPTTWVYLSSLLIIGIFFKFRRLWSIRNLDLAVMIALAPGLLMVLPESPGQPAPNEQLGYEWLFSVGAFFLVRLLVDPVMVRRPLLEPNLTTDGLTFTGLAIFIFLIANVVKEPPNETDIAGAQQFDQVLLRRDPPAGADENVSLRGPGYPLFYALASFPNRGLLSGDKADLEPLRRYNRQAATAKTVAIIAHMALLVGLVLIGYRHFDNFQTGVAAATLYLLLPYTAQMTGHLEHAVPAALLVWSIEAYRRPVIAGLLLGAAAGAVYYPLFLLPLWCSFYWRRGLFRFVAGVSVSLLLMVISLALVSNSFASFVWLLQQMFGATPLLMKHVNGFWLNHQPEYRWPVLAAFLALCGSFALWPAQKNLGTLLSCSAAVMLGIQFWRAHYGGLYMAWYLPLLILTVFRPNLEDRVALTALTEGWFFWRRPRSAVVKSTSAAA